MGEGLESVTDRYLLLLMDLFECFVVEGVYESSVGYSFEEGNVRRYGQ